MSNQVITKSHHQKAQIARDIILANIPKHFAIPDLAKKVGLVDFLLKKAFKEQFGVGLYEYHRKAKLDRAKELLLTTDLPMKAIAAQSGFERLTSFITSFKKEYGKPPAKYVAGRKQEITDNWLFEKKVKIKINKANDCLNDGDLYGCQIALGEAINLVETKSK